MHKIVNRQAVCITSSGPPALLRDLSTVITQLCFAEIHFQNDYLQKFDEKWEMDTIPGQYERNFNFGKSRLNTIKYVKVNNKVGVPHVPQ